MRFRPAVVTLLLVAPVSLVPPSPAQAAGFRCDGKAATIVGTSGQDVLTGTSGDDVIVGRAGRDTIDGRGGDDVICGKGGQDVIDGGAGNDHLSGGTAKDWLTGGSGNDHLVGGRGTSNSFSPGPDDDTVNAMSAPALFNYSAAPGPVTVDLEAGTSRGWGRDTLHIRPGSGAGLGGSAFGDTLLGTSGPDSISGGGGVDTIDGRAGGDTIAATAGVLTGGDGVDSLSLRHAGSIDGGPDRDHVFASWDVAAIDGGDGDDVLEVSAPHGVTSKVPGLSGGQGHDELRLVAQFQAPDDSLVYDMTSGSLQFGAISGVAPGFEDFTVAGTPSMIDVTGTDGPNHITTETTVDATLRGLGGADVFFAGSGDDTVDGGDGNDTIYGSMGDDTIGGGPGTDAADGGPGTDSCTAVEGPTNCETVTP